jgi:putative ABC transport system permease protein
MFTITLQDLRFRARQFVIAVIGAGLVFAMTLLLAGLAAGFGVEINQTVQGVGAQSWALASGSVGRVAALSPIPESDVSALEQTPGVTHAVPLIVVPQPARVVGGPVQSVNLIGYQPGQALGGPGEPVAGRAVMASGEAVVDSRMNLGIGGRFTVSGHMFKVVGVVSNRSLLGGTPNAYVTIGDAQDVIYGGRPLIGAVLISGTPRGVPTGLQLLSNTQIEAASLAQMAQGVSSISNSRALMWLIAALIVAALVYVTALERTRDFAVLKAVGASTRKLFAGLAAQAVIVALAAAVIAAAVSSFMTGLFAQPVDIPASAFVVLPLSALVVGLLASLAALRRAASIDPASAFAGA